MSGAVLPELIARYPELDECVPDIDAAFQVLVDCFEKGGKLLLCGNGGSAADCEHLVGELMKGFLSKRPLPAADRTKLLEAFPDEGEYLAAHLQGALPAISLVSQSGLITAFANDVAADMVYAQQVYGYGRPGDVLIGISTSGRSKNVLNALRVARYLGMATIGFSGRSGGDLPELSDVVVRVPEDETLKIQERHLPIYHALCEMLELALFPE
ncbi:MAG TPA: SIS domain-containing protein [Trueperaceae bacterium]